MQAFFVNDDAKGAQSSEESALLEYHAAGVISTSLVVTAKADSSDWSKFLNLCFLCGKDASKSDLIQIFWTLVWHFWTHALGFGILSRTRDQFPESKEPLLAWGLFESFSKNWWFSWKELQFSTGESLDFFQSQLRLKTGSMIFENHLVNGNLS